MEQLKIWFTDFWPEWEIEDFITPILKKYYDIVIDKNSPDILFHSIFNRMVETPQFKCKKVLILAENWRPSQFESNYSISFDPYSETNFRLPLWQMYLLLWPELKDRLYNRKNWKEEEFERWCAFAVSNPSNFIRNSAYQILNEYKHVNSYGKVFNNTNELQRYSEGKYWRNAKYEFFMKHPHKFMITYENTACKYYCTEKLMDAFLVGSLPIYWGSTTIHKEFNEKSFLNVTRMEQDKAFQLIKDIDKNYNLFLSMYKEPVFTEDQKNELDNNLKNFEGWLISKIKE